MLEIYFPIENDVRVSVLELVQTLALTLGDGLVVAVDTGDNDLDLVAAWSDGLVGDLISDIDELLAFLSEECLGQGPQQVGEVSAEGILRAASAMRLKIQQTLLAGIPESRLEDGEVDPEAFLPEERRGYVAYTVLAALQGVVLLAIDPNLKEFF